MATPWLRFGALTSDKADVYAQLGLRPTYQSQTRTVRAEARPAMICAEQGVRGPNNLVRQNWIRGEAGSDFTSQYYRARSGESALAR